MGDDRILAIVHNIKDLELSEAIEYVRELLVELDRDALSKNRWSALSDDGVQDVIDSIMYEKERRERLKEE